MNKAIGPNLPADLASELERKFFWWEPVVSAPRSQARILAQAMNLAPYDDIRHLERRLGAGCLVQAMLAAEPGWFSERSWEFWRGRLARETGADIPDAPPRRSFDAAAHETQN
jgi:hypothetical protein